MSITYESSPHLPLLIKDILHDTQVDIPLQYSGEKHTISQERHRHSQIEDITIDHGDEIVVLAHDAICNVVSIHSLLGEETIKTTSGWSGGIWIRIAEFHQSLDHILPRDSLNVDL
jgi:hypothetical protein